MLCDRCKKNEATVHIKEFHNGKCTNLHLCQECAAKDESAGSLPGIGFNLAEVLMNVNKLAGKLAGDDRQQPQPPSPVCPACGWDLEKIRKNDGKMGCPECYRTFDPLIKKAISHVQHGSLHLGKRPRGVRAGSPAARRGELEALKKELQTLIAREEYEAAALCRDRINMLRQELDSADGSEVRS